MWKVGVFNELKFQDEIGFSGSRHHMEPLFLCLEGLHYPQNSKLLQFDNSDSAQEWFQGLMSPCGYDSAMLHAMYAHCKTDSPTVRCSICRVHVTQDLFTIWFCPTVKNVSLGQWHWNPCSVVTQQSLKPAIHSGTQRKISPQMKWPFFDQTPYLSYSLWHQNMLSKLNTRSVPFSMDPYTHNPQLYWNTLAAEVTACCYQQRSAWHKENRISGIVWYSVRSRIILYTPTYMYHTKEHTLPAVVTVCHQHRDGMKSTETLELLWYSWRSHIRGIPKPFS